MSFLLSLFTGPAGWVAAGLEAMGMTKGVGVASKVITGVIFLLLALTIFNSWKDGLVADALNELRADQAEETIRNINTADEIDDALREADDDRDDAVGEAIDDAVSEYPQAAAGSAGPASNAALDSLRDDER